MSTADTSMMYLTCKNHRRAVYLTKRIPGRGLHFIAADPDVVRAARPEVAESVASLPQNIQDQILSQYPVECECPFGDLMEIPEPAREI